MGRLSTFQYVLLIAETTVLITTLPLWVAMLK